MRGSPGIELGVKTLSREAAKPRRRNTNERHRSLFSPVHNKQLLTYLRLMDLPLGLLINYGSALFKDGVERVVNNHHNFASSRLRVHQSLPQTRQDDPTRRDSIPTKD